MIFYRTLSLEISGPDEALVSASLDEVKREVERITNKQLKRAPVRVANQLYQQTTKNGPDRNNPLERRVAA